MIVAIVLTLLYVAIALTWFVYTGLQHKKQMRKFIREMNASTNRICAVWECKSHQHLTQPPKKAGGSQEDDADDKST